MKRTAEMSLGVIGVSIDALLGIAGIIIMVIGTTTSSLTGDTGWEFFDVLLNMFFAFFQLIWIPIMTCFISLILGIIALLTLKRHANVAGAFFIAAAVISSWLLLAFGSFQSLLYLAAGLLCFFRKNNVYSPVRKKISK